MEIYERIFRWVTAFYTKKWLRLILLVINLALSVFDCYTDFEVWRTLTNEGFQHPLLQVPRGWVTAWLVVTILGTITAFLNVLNEISFVLDLYEKDVCTSCTGVGCNFVTRSEALSLINIIVEDLPLLILTILYGATRYSCNHPAPSDGHESSILRVVLLSSLASTVAIGWAFLRGMFRILVRYRRNTNRVINISHTEKNDEIDHEKLDANELYPRKHNMNHCMAIHTFVMVLFHIVTLLLCLAAVVTTVVLLTHGAVGVNVYPSNELNVYLKYPNGQVNHLTNTSAVIERGNEGLCHNITFNQTADHELKCTLLLKYDSDDSQLEFNFASISGVIQRFEPDCDIFFEDSDIFLGHNTPTEGVKRFDKNCLAALLTSENGGSVQRNRELHVLC